jgi:hypothetical protein
MEQLTTLFLERSLFSDKKLPVETELKQREREPIKGKLLATCYSLLTARYCLPFLDHNSSGLTPLPNIKSGTARCPEPNPGSGSLVDFWRVRRSGQKSDHDPETQCSG